MMTVGVSYHLVVTAYLLLTNSKSCCCHIGYHSEQAVRTYLSLMMIISPWACDGYSYILLFKVYFIDHKTSELHILRAMVMCSPMLFLKVTNAHILSIYTTNVSPRVFHCLR